jgi:FkbM family methyltransferase
MSSLKHGLRKLGEPLLPYFPARILTRLIKQRPYLAMSLPNGFQLKWPYYLEDVTVFIDPGNDIENQMVWGDYQSDVSRAIRYFVKPGDFCVDVGANTGPVTLLLAKLTGPTGKVLSIEPGPPYYKRLLTNLDLNPSFKKIVTTVNMGISDSDGMLLWAADPEHTWNAGFLNVTEGTSVPVTTLDACIKQLGWSKLDFVKIDVEGMELEVLKGSQETLKKFRPKVLFETMEIFRGSRGFDIFLEMVNLFKGLNYRLYNLTEARELVEVHYRTLPDNTLALPAK